MVGSAVNGIPDVIEHGSNGWLCREKDPESLRDQILTALDDPEDSQVLEAVDATAERYSWPRVAEHYAGAFDRLEPLR